MRTWLIALLLLVAAGAGAQSDEAPSTADQAAIRGVIEGQIDALKRGDVNAAWSAASPTIQKMFGTPEMFILMVRGKYPMCARPKQVEFRQLKQDGKAMHQDVFLVGPDGKGVIATYDMQQQPDGTWKINGVQIQESAEIAV